jgi:transposase
MGNTTLRTLRVLGATTVVSHARRGAKAGATGPAWLSGLLTRRPPKLVAVALANKMARIVYAMLTKGTQYRKADTASGEPAAA